MPSSVSGQDLPLPKRATSTNESSVINEEGRRAIDRRTRSAKQTKASPDGEGENATQVDNRLAKLTPILAACVLSHSKMY